MKQRIGPSARWFDVGAAVLATAVATFVRLALEPILGPGAVPFITYFPAVLLVAWLRGRFAGLLAVVLGTVAADYFFMAQNFGLIPDRAQDWVALAVFLVVGLGMAWMGDAQKRAVAAANRERQRFETTLASIGDAVIATDAEGRIVFANPVARSLLRSPRDLVGQDLHRVFRIIHEETREPVESPVEKVLREGAVVALANHTALLAGDGTEIPIDDTAAPIKDGDGKVVGAVLVFRDIGERRRAQRARRLLAAIVESTSDAIMSKDLQGNITSWNAGAERIFGYTEKEVLGRPVSILAVPGRNEMPVILDRIRRGERIAPYETVRRTKEGETLHVSLSVSPLLDDDGRVIGASKIVRDISERRRTQEALQRSNEDLERFAFMASHDLQEPLRMITAYGQLLSRSLSLPPGDEHHEFLGQILDG
ncbi:MAG TPA: PAS domain S-box protein, partial [Candidatus Polarisedimenticolaceae bacterium]|nr:PAS domain S-box protein [Candidatus Polarisedimenticolaceae bacterium]